MNSIPRGLESFKDEILGDNDLGWAVFKPGGSKPDGSKSSGSKSGGSDSDSKKLIVRRRSEKFKKFWLNLDKNYSNKDELVLALLYWNGSGLGPWTGIPVYEDFPPRLIDEIEISQIVHAIKSRELKEPELEGAAKYFSGFKRTHLGSLLPADLHKKLLDHTEKSSDQDKISRARQAFKPHE